MKKLITLIAILTIALVSCSDDDSITNPSGSELLPLAVGNWWDYEVFEYDADTETQGTKESEYRIEVVGQTEFEGRQAYELNQIRNGETETIYYSLEDNNIYLGGVEFGESVSVEWYKLYDSRAKEWETLNFEFNLFGTESKIKGTGSYEGEIDVSIGGQIYEGILIKQTIVSESKITFEGQTEETKSTIVGYYQIVKGIGIFQITSIYDDEFSIDEIEILSDYDVSN